MTASDYTLFDTPIGECGIGWTGSRVVALQLPEVTAAATRERLASLTKGGLDKEPPQFVQEVIAGIRRHLAGELDDLRWAPLDTTALPPFDRKVYTVTRAIDPGNTLTYGEVAELVDSRGAAQAVGQALGRNPIPILIPCHRVLAAGNRIGGFSAYGAVRTKRTLLTIEHAPGFDDPVLF
ncbi:methylated-DNA--[protein]-cysteine S-methyltransferase [Antrihabitans sp. YC2-6]|uniref:methylated-DNA--[protein]-cysteine S-methyltransferase n=1 Tax=Antrihabitans sp. YC2-6 TaxID=2799498 RepID=UPI0018F77BF9|nr:methylated-DNA--[protein]-cysteine S-methyltransferase [Antrihabitans sp. YC2-6]MBJ8348538.1 methylated-DNA--[protein]-cysteine S-methyltransferase [Antrihabitans sp. YC2-6]